MRKTHLLLSCLVMLCACSQKLSNDLKTDILIDFNQMRLLVAYLQAEVSEADNIENISLIISSLIEKENNPRFFSNPVSESKYSVNPNLSLWKQKESPSGKVAIYNPDGFGTNSKNRVYTAVGFDGELMKLRQLPEF